LRINLKYVIYNKYYKAEMHLLVRGIFKRNALRKRLPYIRE